MTQSWPLLHPHLSSLPPSLCSIQPHMLFGIPASELLHLLVPQPGKLFPHRTYLSSPHAYLPLIISVSAPMTPFRKTFPNHSSPHSPVSNILNHIFLFHFLWQSSISNIIYWFVYLFICWVYYCLSGPLSCFYKEGRDHICSPHISAYMQEIYGDISPA